MSIKKCVNGSFVNDFYKEYGTDTDTITTLPKTIIGDGQNISAYTIKGNMTQSGTPTPSNPIYPTECGDKTANLFDLATCTLGKYINASGAEVTSSASTEVAKLNHTDYISVTAGEAYTYHYESTGSTVNNTIALCWFDSTKTIISRDTKNVTEIETEYSLTATAPNNAAYCIINFTGYSDLAEFSFNVGTTPLPYEPFGYKIPISLNNVTYPIYISEPLRKSLDGSNLYDTIESNGTLTRRVDANGDALATPTTEQVTVPTLTTTGTPEQFNVLTTLAPSEVSLTWHGWHEHADTKYSNP